MTTVGVTTFAFALKAFSYVNDNKSSHNYLVNKVGIDVELGGI